MNASSPIQDFSVLPGYERGFTFSWRVSPTFVESAPWTFCIEEAETPNGPWTGVSPQLTGIYAYQSGPRLAPLDPVLYFRLRFNTGAGTHYSDVISPYGKLPRSEFLQAREVIRNELVQARNMSGIEGRVFIKSVFGPPCTSCRDPVTGEVQNPRCPICLGVGKVPGYHGPYKMWMVFSTLQRNKRMEDGSVTEVYVHQVRMVGHLVVKKDDVLVDPISDRRYYVNAVTNLFELRRVPLVQNIEAREAPKTESIFSLE